MSGPEKESSSAPDDSRAKPEAPLVEGSHRGASLSHEDAVAGCPDDVAVVGEEDAGIGVEYLVRESEDKAKARKGK